MRQYRYVMVASDGTSFDFARHDEFSDACYDLPDLLADGWKPVRETPMGSGTWIVEGQPVSYALALVLLEKKFTLPKVAAKKSEQKKGAVE